MKDIILIDGAVGTSLWEKSCDTKPVWTYVRTNKKIVEELAKEYLEAGSKVILADTFAANRTNISKLGYDSSIVTEAIKITKDVVKGTDTKVAFGIGPLPDIIEPYGDLSEEECAQIYEEMLDAGMKEDPDIIYFQTFIDLGMLKIAVETARKYNKPIWATMSFEKNGKTIFGNSVEDIINELEPLGVSALGINCSLGPVQALPIIKEFSEKTNLPLIFKPNAGLPVTSLKDGSVHEYTQSMFANEVSEAFKYATYIGGCCGCNASFIKELNNKINNR